MGAEQMAFDIKTFAVQGVQAGAYLLTQFGRDAQRKSVQGQYRLSALRPDSQHGSPALAAEGKQFQHQQTRKLERRGRWLRLLDDAPRALYAAFMLQVRESPRELQLGGQSRYRYPQSVHGIAEELDQRLEQALGPLRARAVALIQFLHGVEQQIGVDLRLKRLQSSSIEQRLGATARHRAVMQQMTGALHSHREITGSHQQ